jgi:DNA-binding transcriptional LysR family regulator
MYDGFGMSRLTFSDALQQKGLKLSHLRLIGELADTSVISQAADQIGITQPAASRLLAEIEQIVGAPVHLRSGRGVSLTAVGAALARRAKRIQMELRNAVREMAEVASGSVGHVRLGAVTGPALDRVLPALRTARLTEPGVTAEVIVATSDILAQQLLTGRIDFAIARMPSGPDRALLDIRMIAVEPVSLVVRRGHPLHGRAGLQARDLLAFDWVMPGPDSILARAVIARLSALGLPDPPQRLSTASFLLTLALLQQSNAIAPLASAVAASFARAPDVPNVELAIDLGIEVEAYGLMTRAGTTLTLVAQRLADSMIIGA